jgi:hypothetical protein
MNIVEQMVEKEDLERKYRIAIGYISTMPEFSDKHPLEVAAHFDAKYKELREATTELLKAIDGLFPTDGPVKARVRAALKENE